MRKVTEEFLSTFEGLTGKDYATALAVAIGLYGALLAVTKVFIALA